MSGPGHNRLAELAGEISQAHRDSRTAAERAAERAISAGHLLLEAKALVRHGEWAEWLTVNVAGMSERTAQRYMRLAKVGLKSATVADLGVRGADEALAEFRDLAELTDAETLTGLGLASEQHGDARVVFEFAALGRVAERLWPGEFEKRLAEAEKSGAEVGAATAFAILRDLTQEVSAPAGSRPGGIVAIDGEASRLGH